MFAMQRHVDHNLWATPLGCCGFSRWWLLWLVCGWRGWRVLAWLFVRLFLRLFCCMFVVLLCELCEVV